ncbi:hypothetical protein IPA_00625 [Ignicoccus pacificus DSM 13166]|uniref:Uncharacterized protein n=1 Tax=Ignicoccus pacificus DSM 13166 TaxID=940294 RepID=A0A977PL62_9CREN|nr:hypothetical protein IPA_00625 [Ignicoccus pacificus DSM 13166]
MLIPASMKERFRIRFENNMCDVDGRSFNSEHVVLVSPSWTKIRMSDEGIYMEAEYESPPKTNSYGNHIIVGATGEKYLPVWDSLKGEAIAEEDKILGKGELGIRASANKHYITLEVLDKNKGSVLRLYGNEVELEGDAIDFVNVLGIHYQSFYVKTARNSKTEIIRENDKIKIKISK